jgi:hypothetical protein
MLLQNVSVVQKELFLFWMFGFFQELDETLAL